LPYLELKKAIESNCVKTIIILLVDILAKGAKDALAVIALPEYYRRRLRSTNRVERINKEIV